MLPIVVSSIREDLSLSCSNTAFSALPKKRCSISPKEEDDIDEMDYDHYAIEEYKE